MDHRQIIIVLATCNGGRFLREQVRSIQQQTERRWSLLIRDDGSQDDTREILRQLARDDARIHLLEEGGERLGPAGNFGRLMERACERGAECVLCADQDDVWHAEKLATQLQALRAAESQAAPGTRILVHSDLEVVDAALRPINSSLLAHLRLNPQVDQPLRTLLVQNFVTGCTLLVNRPLLEFALPLPCDGAMHDWWLAQCAAAAGRIVYLPQALVRYRQHGGNRVGATSPLRAALRLCGGWRRRVGEHGENVRQGIAQVRELCRRIDEGGWTIDPAAAELIRAYCAAVDAAGGWECVRRVFALGVRPQSFLKQVALLVQLALLRRGDEQPCLSARSRRAA